MADPADKASPFQPFSDIVGGQRDEGYVNLSNDITKKVSIPSNCKSGSIMLYNASTGRFEAYNGSNGTVLSTNSAAGVGFRDIITMQSQAATGAVTLTVASQDITGASITFNTVGTNAKVLVTAQFDFAHTVVGGGIAVGQISVDAVATGPQALLSDIGSAANRSTHPTSVTVALATPGSHTIKLIANKTIAAGTVIAQNAHTHLALVIYDP